MKNFEAVAPTMIQIFGQAIWNSTYRRWDVSLVSTESYTNISGEYKVEQTTFSAQIDSNEEKAIPAAVLECYGNNANELLKGVRIVNPERNF